jgi:hypothetical protein
MLLILLGINQVQTGFFLAAEAGARFVSTDGTGMAVVGDPVDIFALVNEEGSIFNRINLEDCRGSEVAFGLHIESREARVVQDFLGGRIAAESYHLMIGRLQDRRLPLMLYESAAGGGVPARERNRCQSHGDDERADCHSFIVIAVPTPTIKAANVLNKGIF